MNLRITCNETNTIICDESVTVDVVCKLGAKTVDYLYTLGARYVPFTFFGHGVATYKKGDEQDAELGYKVARKKAIRQAYKYIENFINDLLNFLEENYENAFKSFLEICGRTEQQTMDIIELTKEEEVKGN